MTQTPETLSARQLFTVQGEAYVYFSLPFLAQNLDLGYDLRRLPVSLKILLEGLLRHQERGATREHLQALTAWGQTRTGGQEIPFFPSRVLMQDFTGVPVLVDLAAMRDALHHFGEDPARVNPSIPVDLVIDHSIVADAFGDQEALDSNVHLEFARNGERYQFLKWGQNSFENFRLVPPGKGICHQVNLEYLAPGIGSDGGNLLFPDTVIGTDSHTTMINALGVLGWGVGGIEAEAAMLGQPLSLVIPKVFGVRLSGTLPSGTLATDLVLTLTHLLRQRGVVDSFVEFFGPGLDQLSLPDRATLANMAPEFGATCAFFPIDQITLDYLTLTGRPAKQVQLLEAYAKLQGLWRTEDEPLFSEVLTVDLNAIEPTLAGPKRPQDRVFLSQVAVSSPRSSLPEAEIEKHIGLQDGDVVIAAITSCTNTSNPEALVVAGLLAQKAVSNGLSVKPWVKTSLAPGSQVVTQYLRDLGLEAPLEALGFYTVGYGCTTCIGNSGPLPEAVAQAITKGDLSVAAVLSGNRNFEGRIHPLVKLNYLASPPLVVAYALAGKLGVDLTQEPLGTNHQGEPVFLKDLWPSREEVQEALAHAIGPDLFPHSYAKVLEGSSAWQALPTETSHVYPWDSSSTYIQKPPYFDSFTKKPPFLPDIKGASILALLGDSVTTDHISPAGSIPSSSVAGRYLLSLGVSHEDLSSYGARRGNHEVMVRGTFANPQLRNEMVPDQKGGLTRHVPSGEVVSFFEAAERYQKTQTPLVIVAGKEYGTGSSRDWAAKGPHLLGVKAVLAESFERIHRSNLVGMGILPLQFLGGMTRHDLKLTGTETINVEGILGGLDVQADLTIHIQKTPYDTLLIPVRCCLITEEEVAIFQNGGLLPAMLRRLLEASRM